jgi:hypothetical protein
MKTALAGEALFSHHPSLGQEGSGWRGSLKCHTILGEPRQPLWREVGWGVGT